MVGKAPHHTPAEPRLSGQMSIYLAKAYRLADFQDEPDGYVGTSALADTLDVTAPAVNRMVNRLKELGLLEHEPYKGIRLTEQGRTEALKFLHNHRVVESFLATVMQLDWSEVFDEANRICEAASPAIIARMYVMAGKPAFCPHGEPIPTPDGRIAPMHDQRLAHSVAGDMLRVTRLRTREPDRLKYIAALGLMPHATLEVLHVAPFNGPMQLRVGKEYRIVGSNLADLIRVERA